MKYNYKKIGRRIKETRKAKGFSQERLMNALRDNQIPVGRNTLSAMENGVFESFSFQVLSGIATLCDCEIGYLLCEYDCKTFDNSQIYKKTGLSDNAINGLQLLHFPIDSIWDSVQVSRYDIIALNFILEDFYDKMTRTPDYRKFGEETDTLLNRIGQYIDSGSSVVDVSQNGKLDLYRSDDIVQAICRDKITLLLKELKDKYSLEIIDKRIENNERFKELYNDSVREYLANNEKQNEKNNDSV
ncbi:MAG: helix-turn-helix transcriptional regulator [Lachnospiraceae bacterium]|jgi:transcriptional regulator with XRE-family HTH domain|nr:helix-turn-helix transcriptional regulator [Lachnospiraceae bacterium]